MELIFNGDEYNRNFINLTLLSPDDEREDSDFEYDCISEGKSVVLEGKVNLNLSFLLTDYVNNKESFDQVFALLN
jgi:hypothetical protein